MVPFLSQLAAIATCLVLALPPGWCAVLTRHGGPQPAKKSCCHPDEESRPCEGPRPPAAPMGKCCCAWDATVPNDPVKVPDGGTLPLLIVAENAMETLGRLIGVCDSPLD